MLYLVYLGLFDNIFFRRHLDNHLLDFRSVFLALTMGRQILLAERHLVLATLGLIIRIADGHVTMLLESFLCLFLGCLDLLNQLRDHLRFGLRTLRLLLANHDYFAFCAAEAILDILLSPF